MHEVVLLAEAKLYFTSVHGVSLVGVGTSKVPFYAQLQQNFPVVLV
jgi:hypothetical protein